MNKAFWENRIQNRADLVTRVTHLTRGETEDAAFDRLWRILLDKRIRASNEKGINAGGAMVCCFQEIPLYSIAENLQFEEATGACNRRYSAFGIRVLKGQFFQRGGRPVIYVDKELKDRLPKQFVWEMVSMDLNDPESIVDWSHEREWRIHNDYVFDYADIEIIVSTPTYYRKLIEKCLAEGHEDIIKSCNGITVMNSVYN